MTGIRGTKYFLTILAIFHLMTLFPLLSTSMSCHQVCVWSLTLKAKSIIECTKFIFQYEPESAMIFSLSVTSQSWVSRSRTKSASVEVRDRLTSLVMSGDCGAELRVSPAVREVEAENCTAVNSASLHLDIHLSIHQMTTLRNHLRSKLFVTRIFLSMRRPPYFWRTKNFQ